MKLGYEFILASIAMFLMLLPLYIYVKKRKNNLFEKSDLDHFKHEVEIYFTNRHPFVELDYSVFETSKEQATTDDMEEVMVIEDLVSQFIQMPYALKTQPSVGKELQWATYEENSFVKKDKIPKDLSQRKELVYRRDLQTCKRCGQKLKPTDAYLGMIKKIEDGGTYHLENLVTFCVDCNRIVKSDEPSKLASSLKIYDDLIHLSNRYS